MPGWSARELRKHSQRQFVPARAWLLTKVTDELVL